ncbi:MAG: transcriptional repressor [Chloroflexi bacterium]|nr:transcriptional repressor [Chloroflexota bacterium]
MGHPDLSHLRDGHHRLTPQRRLIWGLLHDSDDHISAEQLHRAAVARMADLSRPTVYRTLVDLVLSGHVREIAVPHGPSRYETICSDDQHGDLVCNECGHIEKLYAPALDDLVHQATEQHAFLTDNAHLVLYGTCGECRRTLSKSA